MAAGCLIAGWRLVQDHPVPPIDVHRAAPAAVQDTGGPAPLPLASPVPGSAGQHAGALGLTPGADLLARLSRDDSSLYRTQWQVIQLLVDGTRRFLEQRVLPALMAAAR